MKNNNNNTHWKVAQKPTALAKTYRANASEFYNNYHLITAAGIIANSL